MAKHYLDPKQTSGPHDVSIEEVLNHSRRFCWRKIGTPWAACYGSFATEAEALTAARKAAGYETEE